MTPPRGGGEFSVLDVYGDTLLFLPPSNRPESAESTDFTKGVSSQASSAVSLGLSCSRGGCRDSRRVGACSLGLTGGVEDDEEEVEDDMGLNQPRPGAGL